MTRPAARDRSRQGRLLTVGAAPSIEGLRRTLRGATIHAENLFEAIGEVSIAPASAPIDAILLGAESVRTAGGAVRALRRIDPVVQIIVVAGADDELDTATTTAVDHCLRAPVDAAQLNELLGFGALDESIPETAETEAPRGTEPAVMSAPPSSAHGFEPGDARPAEPAAREPALETRAATAPAAPEPPEPPLVESLPAPTAPAPAPAPRAKAVHDPGEPSVPLPPEADLGVTAETPATPGTLGDVDLVQALIIDPRGVRDSALRLLRQQSGWSDVELLPDEPPIGRAASVPVERDGRTFGRLGSCRALAHELQPWARWLACWLALDEQYRAYREMAFHDELTGAWNRRFFFRFLGASIDRARRQRRTLTLLVFDIDDFKHYNDDFGHAAGDEILVETVRLLRSVIRKGDRVCRIGGDEFAVIFSDPEGPREAGSSQPEAVEEIARRFQDQVCRMRFPKLGLQAPGTLSISGGLATYPWDGIDPGTLLEHADRLALQSKRRGKNVITFGPGVQAPGAGRETD